MADLHFKYSGISTLHAIEIDSMDRYALILVTQIDIQNTSYYLQEFYLKHVNCVFVYPPTFNYIYCSIDIFQKIESQSDWNVFCVCIWSYGVCSACMLHLLCVPCVCV